MRVILNIVRTISDRRGGGPSVSDEKSTKTTAFDGLSPRERQVLKFVVEGRTSKEIAAIVCVKPSTIDIYRSRVMAKLEINNVPSLVRLAIRHGLIKL